MTNTTPRPPHLPRVDDPDAAEIRRLANVHRALCDAHDLHDLETGPPLSELRIALRLDALARVRGWEEGRAS